MKKAPKQRWVPLPEGSTTVQSMVIPDVDENRNLQLDDATTDELKNLSKLIDQSNRTVELENSVFERYLSRMDPNALLKMNEILEATTTAMQKAERQALLEHTPSYDQVNKLTEETSMMSGIDSASNRSRRAQDEKDRRVQPAHKIEMVNREIEELRNVLQEHRKKARQFNYVLRCRTEELSERLQEITEARKFFEQKLLIESVDPLTGKLPGEKFMRFFEMRVKQKEIEIDKMRIKTGSLKNQLKKVHQQLAQKEEIGEVLHAVDFEQLQVENNEFQKRLEEKNMNLAEIKKINGKYGNLLNVQKKKLLTQMNKLAKLEGNKSNKEKLIKQLAVDEEKVNSEVKAAAKSVQKISQLIDSYEVPDLMEYIKKKAEMCDLKKELKIKERKMKLSTLALMAQYSKMKNILSSSKSQISQVFH